MKIKVSLWLAVFVAFLTIQNVGAFEEKYYIPGAGSIQDKWFGSLDFRDAINDSTLRVGGWGSWNATLVKMPVHFYVPGTSRLIITRATLNMYSLDSKNPTTMHKYLVRTPWSESSISDQWGLTINPQSQIPAPLPNSLYSFDIAPEFFAWLTGAEPNYGILLMPDDVNNKFNYFRSSENKLEWQPYIEVFYERNPRFKMPLAGNKAWKLTVEIGGPAYDGTIDENHTEGTYYSLDFSPRWKALTGGAEQLAIDPPVYAAASGKVYQVASNALNGWFIRIDHDSDDSKQNTGFQTTYLHLKQIPLFGEGAFVQQGQQIGIMGKTGTADVHLHVTFYFKGTGGTPVGGWNDSAYLNLVRMENRLLKDYKLNATPSIPIYYQSTNTE
ncbi:MAG: peptidoglycan DD-metalloendopeptidase family protein [Patescibacteria group bacterium]